MALLEVHDLKVHFPVRGGVFRGKVGEIRAVDGVSLTVEEGQTVGLVGESGSGKTTVGRAILKLGPITSGSVKFQGREISGLNEGEFRPLRRQMQMIFQDPFGSLNPRMQLGDIIGEAIEIHFPKLSRRERLERVAGLMEKVALPTDWMRRFPHELSGGQRQRVGIARALAVEPKFIVCDEPVSALDVSIQAQIVNLLQDLQEQMGLAYLFIAHDMAVVEHMSDVVHVMRRGQIVESAPAEQIYSDPQHEYTKSLLAAIPSLA